MFIRGSSVPLWSLHPKYTTSVTYTKYDSTVLRSFFWGLAQQPGTPSAMFSSSRASYFKYQNPQTSSEAAQHDSLMLS
ncbi:hypothetical protein CVT25_002591 [Psilocybe cyanescens]|uniref:Uncharacterized protein n=1 Tax=Psilocybe cyanescens TaxID=93625 RepID=A0A409WL97_PSICY|nr:hypothetical protein CVT25_002591 [Psilocybe cyanescens]